MLKWRVVFYARRVSYSDACTEGVDFSAHGDVFRSLIKIYEVDAANVKRSIFCVLVVFVNVWCCLVIPRRFTKNIVRKEAFL